MSSTSPKFSNQDEEDPHKSPEDNVVPPSFINGSFIQTFGSSSVFTVGRLFLGWYLFSALFNIYAKKSLNNSHAVTPLFNATVQCIFGIVISFFLLGGDVFSRVIRLSRLNWLLFLTTSFLHFAGNWMTTKSIASASIAFAHIIKAAEPVFTVILTRIILKKRYSIHLYSSLIPIVGGVGLVIVGKFSAKGNMPQLDEKVLPAFLGAMISNLCFASRNVLSKQLFDTIRKKEEEEAETRERQNENEDIDNRKQQNNKDEVFAMYSVWSSAFGLFFILIETFAVPFQNPALGSTISIFSLVSPSHVLVYCCIAGVCHALYNAFSLKVLTHVAAVTHAVGNCMKRVFVLLASFVIFGMHMTGLMIVGSVVAIVGVFLYSVEKTQPDPTAPILPGATTSSTTASASPDRTRSILRAMPFVCLGILFVALIQNNQSSNT